MSRYGDYYDLCLEIKEKVKIIIEDKGTTIEGLEIAKELYEKLISGIEIKEACKDYKKFHLMPLNSEDVYSNKIYIDLTTGEYINCIYDNAWKNEAKNREILNVTFPMNGNMKTVANDIEFLKKNENKLMIDGHFFPYVMCKKRDF